MIKVRIRRMGHLPYFPRRALGNRKWFWFSDAEFLMYATDNIPEVVFRKLNTVWHNGAGGGYTTLEEAFTDLLQAAKAAGRVL